ncbi:MAG TPA: hypothetical protein VFU36_01740 [Jatrophihabitans sp.]|nr:hypothetical protein [Jatrophihabitans sp.]
MFEVLLFFCVIVICFISFLVFLGFVLVRTGSTEGFRDVAVAVHAFADLLRGRNRMGRADTDDSR